MELSILGTSGGLCWSVSIFSRTCCTAAYRAAAGPTGASRRLKASGKAKKSGERCGKVWKSLEKVWKGAEKSMKHLVKMMKNWGTWWKTQGTSMKNCGNGKRSVLRPSGVLRHSADSAHAGKTTARLNLTARIHVKAFSRNVNCYSCSSNRVQALKKRPGAKFVDSRWF